MCGIFGRYSFRGYLGDHRLLQAGTDCLAHRGPDGSGFWWNDHFFLGHRRLAVIDLDSGAQPLGSSDNSLWISFNGEIYNYLELRAELSSLGHTFRTNSDTEVILAGYRQWREDVCKKLVGMFAFAIVDIDDRSLFVARDRFGEKPLFVLGTADSITFASELKSFRGLPEFSGAIDMEALGEFLCLNYISGNGTLVTGVRRLPPATWRRYRSSTDVTEEVYWRVPEHPTGEMLTEKEVLAETKRRIDQSVALTLRSDVPIALLLSGGIDSSLIAESAVRQGALKDAFCLDFPEASHSEFDKAALVSRQLGIDLHRVDLSSDALESFDELVGHLDDPLADSSALAVFFLSKQVAKEFKVVLTGDGGDELFGGYLTYQASQAHSLLARLAPKSSRNMMAHLSDMIPVSSGKVSTTYKIHRFLRAASLPTGEAHMSWNGTWLPRDAANFIASDHRTEAGAEETLRRISIRHRMPDSPTLHDLQRLDIAEYLPNNILTKVDRSTMAWGLESRAPFLNHNLAEYALSLPEGLYRSSWGRSKKILRRLAEDNFPAEISRAKKQGFSIPIHSWLRGPGRALLEEKLSPTHLRECPFLNADAIIRAKNAHLASKAQLGYELWGLLTLVTWCERNLRH